MQYLFKSAQKNEIRYLSGHVFGFGEQSMFGLLILRKAVLIRAKANTALTSLVYNIRRYIQIIRL